MDKLHTDKMLNYCKVILQKVSFDGSLFEKELTKAASWLQPEETKELVQWAEANFVDKFPDIINNIQNLLF